MERNLDFDKITDRHNTKSLKYDFALQRHADPEALPMWVADMDFQTSSYVQDALRNVADHGVFGYSENDDAYDQALLAWEKRRYGYTPDIKWLVKTPGIVFALAQAVRAFTEEGDSILIQQPVYYPFREVIEDNHRNLVSSDLVLDPEENRYVIDFDDFERKIAENHVKLFLLCNPHNPAGRVWTAEELTQIADICIAHHVLIISDEIHRDFALEGKHIEISQLDPKYRDNTIVCTSPSKSFNLAGLQISNIYIANPELRRKFKRQVAASGYSQVGLMGLVACEAAYRYGDTWLDGVVKYIRDNRDYLEVQLHEYFPRIGFIRQEGTYLSWLDFREYHLSAEELKHKLMYEAGLWLDGGEIFGASGEGFERVNIACPRATLEEAVDRLKKVF